MVAQVNRDYFFTNPAGALKRLTTRLFFEGRPITTKGRWANALILAFLRAGPKTGFIEKIRKPIFIIGTGRSGTTILGTILSIHRDIGYLNEPKAIWYTIFPNEDVIGHYSTEKARYRLFEDDADREVIDNAHKLFGFYLKTINSRRLVDKNPELIFRIPFILEIFPDAKFLFLVRNGWETCYSISRWSENEGERDNKHQYDWWGVDDRKWNYLLEQIVNTDNKFADLSLASNEIEDNFNKAAVEWIVTMNEGIKLLQLYPDIFHLVKYEDLTAKPNQVLSQLNDFCEFDFDPRVASFASTVLKQSKKHPKGWLHPQVEPLFSKTLGLLGYTSE